MDGVVATTYWRIGWDVVYAFLRTMHHVFSFLGNYIRFTAERARPSSRRIERGAYGFCCLKKRNICDKKYDTRRRRGRDYILLKSTGMQR